VREVTDAFAMPTTADFDPFGVRTSNSATPFGFTGEHTLQGNSIVYLRARSYMPHLGVFMSLDPLETANRYAYAGGNPVNAVDPSGMVYERPERWHRCSSLSTNSSRQLHMSQGGSFYSQPYEPCAENCSLQMLSGADFEACVENCRRIGIDPWQITPDLQNKILFSSVTLAVIKRDEMCNTIDDVFLDIHQRQGRCTPTQQSIGTVIEGGILTHTHFDRANEDDSNANFLFLNENYDWLFIEGVAFQDVLPIKDITLGISSYGTMLLSLPYPTGRFGYTARLASIDYPNTRPGWVFFAFVPGDNGTAWYEGNMKGYSAHSTLQVGVAGVYGDNPARRHEFLLIGDYTTEGDSGGGHFDQYGNLVGVLRGAENAGLIPGTGNFFNPLRQAVTKVR
jgi:RHS repeat-associated protein